MFSKMRYQMESSLKNSENFRRKLRTVFFTHLNTFKSFEIRDKSFILVFYP